MPRIIKKESVEDKPKKKRPEKKNDISFMVLLTQVMTIITFVFVSALFLWSI